MNPSELFIRRPVMTVLIMVSAFLFGIACYEALPVNDLPAVDYPVIQVTVSYPGADPETMAANIATPLEKQFMQIQGLQIVTSSSSQGYSSIILQFALNKSIDAAATDVQSAITQATGNLPTDLPSPPVFTKTNPNDAPIMYLGLTSDSLTAGQLYDYANNQIGQRISIITGVSQVSIYGAPMAIRIFANPSALTARGMTLQDLAVAVGNGTQQTGVGQFNGSTKTFILHPFAQLSTVKEYESLIVGYQNNSPVYVRDVARVEESTTAKDMQMDFWYSGYASQPRQPIGVILAISRAAGANAVKVSQNIKDLLPSMRQTLPGSMQLIMINDVSETITASVDDVKETLLIAFILVVIVIFVFLGRASDTVIPSIALPMSLVITFIGMKLLNYSLDNLSLMALTLAVGFLVDDAIVFLENTVRLMEVEGLPAMKAAIKSAEEISFTIISMTVSLAAVFIPLVFMSGIIGRVFQEFAITIIISILASGFVSLSLTPLMCARMLKERGEENKTWMQRFMDHWFGKMLKGYGKTLDVALHHGWISILTGLICLAGTGYLFYILPKTFLPVGDSGFIRGIFIAADETSPDQMKRYQTQVDQIMRKNPAMNMSLTLANAGSFLASSQAFVLAFLKDKEECKRDPIEKVTQELMAQLSSIPGIFCALRPNPVLHISAGATSQNQGQYAFTISGTDEKIVYRDSMKLLQAMWKIPGMMMVSSDLHLTTPQLAIDIKREQASTYGITAETIESTLRNAYSQNYVYLIKTPLQQYQVIVEVDDPLASRPEDLNLLYLKSNDPNQKDLIPINAVASWREILGPQSVNHFNQFASVTIFFDLLPGAPIGDITEKVNQLSKEILDPTLLRSFQGDAQAFEETIVSLVILMFVAVFVMYILLGILYESYIHPITVLVALPVAVVGGLLTLLIFKSELSLYALIGVFMLMGIVKKNGIMMVDFALQRMRAGIELVEATKEACIDRLRPILMTTLAALMGALPIACGYGSDGESRKPLGLTIVGGLLFSQIITLYVTPVVFLYMQKFQDNVLNRFAFFRQTGDETSVPALPATASGEPPVKMKE
ncbi:MAG: efflux RND transporter permease subunit [Verrucomicrobiae bacterium]|nr:efflux RND transporter permease subunit [Verrucomicrobiae bacterium]